MNHAASAAIDSDRCSEVIIAKVTPAQKRFLMQQSRAELRTIANYIRSLVVEKMAEVE
jgi:hypothetical protein